IGSSTVVIEEGDIYTDSGAKAFNEEGEDISENITVEGLPIPTAIGEYTILYRIIDSNGLEASIERKVEVKERKVVVEETSKPRSSRGGRNTRDDEDISNFDIPIMPQVLGAETKSCDAEKLGGPDIESLKNNPEEIKKLQQFLNDELVLMLPVNGSWDDLTSTAFEIFEGRYVKDLYTVNPIDLINQKICS
ncbi:MAG TPA: immunoglobulin-like domain-containing protein, partial [Candidatus Paceibacterota bacterium]|nr:immunoglobulin-like domain-containing protein [Candidatus Paceibacterota bacterium]